MAKKTRKKAASRTKSSQRASRNPYSHCESEILNEIVSPRLHTLFADGATSPATLRSAYNERFARAHPVSEAAFKDWLRICGFTRQPSALVIAPVPAPAQTPDRPAARPPAPAATNPFDDDGEGPEPVLTPPPDLMPGDPGYVLGAGPSAR